MEVTPGSREVGIDVPPDESSPVVSQHSDPQEKNKTLLHSQQKDETTYKPQGISDLNRKKKATFDPRKKSKKNKCEPVPVTSSDAASPNQSEAARIGAVSAVLRPQTSKQTLKSNTGNRPVLKQQLFQKRKIYGRGGSETLNGYSQWDTGRRQWSGYPRGPFSPVSRSLERHYCKGNQRTTFGQDLSNMISNWGN